MQKTYEKATGPIDYKLINDVMFRHTLEHCPVVLNELVRSLLHFKPTDIVEAELMNPISEGENVEDKTFVLDVKILLNKTDILNIEMQVVNQGNWTDRSLSYLCRTFDNLEKGSNYTSTATVIHISILDFTLFPENPEFYASYRLMNVKNQQIYNDKFQLNVLCLNQIGLATDEDKASGLDLWAALFLATTWEDIKMLAQKNPTFDEAAQELFKANADSKTRALAEAREEALRLERYSRWQLKKAQQERDEAQRQAKAAEEALAQKDEALAEQATALAEKDSEIAALRAQLEQLKK